MKREIIKPVGLAGPSGVVDDVCHNAALYTRCGLRPYHLVVPLDPGSGRTTFLQYMAEMYKHYGILRGSEIDDFVEVKLDGTIQQLPQAFAAVKNAAVYSNEYDGIVAVDISDVGTYRNDKQFDEFQTELLKLVKKLCDHACVVFFAHYFPSEREQQLIESLSRWINNVRIIEADPYTDEDMCELIIRNLKKRKIVILELNRFHDILLSMVKAIGITNVADTALLAEEIIRCSGISDSLIINDDSLLTLATKWHICCERGVAK